MLSLFPPPRCVDGLFEALTQIYNDQESSNVLRLTQKVAAVFAKGNRFADGVELEELKQLRADAQASLSFFNMCHHEAMLLRQCHHVVAFCL